MIGDITVQKWVPVPFSLLWCSFALHYRSGYQYPFYYCHDRWHYSTKTGTSTCFTTVMLVCFTLQKRVLVPVLLLSWSVALQYKNGYQYLFSNSLIDANYSTETGTSTHYHWSLLHTWLGSIPLTVVVHLGDNGRLSSSCVLCTIELFQR